MSSTRKPLRRGEYAGPRLVRLSEAHHHLGMDKNRFDAEVRPFLRWARMGKQGIVFHRLDLDAFADEYMSRNGRPAPRGEKAWDTEERQGSVIETGSGTSTSRFSGARLQAAQEQARSKKRT